MNMEAILSRKFTVEDLTEIQSYIEKLATIETIIESEVTEEMVSSWGETHETIRCSVRDMRDLMMDLQPIAEDYVCNTKDFNRILKLLTDKEKESHQIVSSSRMTLLIGPGIPVTIDIITEYDGTEKPYNYFLISAPDQPPIKASIRVWRLACIWSDFLEGLGS